jgi:hypothetical protein
MFRVLLAHIQEALHTQKFVRVYCLLNRLAAPRLEIHSKLGAAKRHNTRAIYQLFCMQGLLKMSKYYSEHVEADNL